MPDYGVEFSQVALAHLLAVASPGPDFALVLNQSLTRGRRAAVWSSVGIGVANLVHIGSALLGLGLLIRGSGIAFDVVKYAGAGYIAWLGVQALRARPRAGGGTAPIGGVLQGVPSGRAAFAAGLLTSVLNPKAMLFYLSLFVLVIDPATPRALQAAYGVWMVLAATGWFCLVSVFFTQAPVRRRFLRYGHWIDRALGVVFLGFAASLAFATMN